MRAALTISLGILILAPALLATVVAAPPDERDLTWSKAEGEQLYLSGKKLFEEKKYKEAYDQFKAARKLAKGRPTRVEVDQWLLGSRGGFELDAMKKQAQGGKTRAVYRRAEKDAKKYRSSPIGPFFDEFVTKLQKELFVTLEDFEHAGKRYSEKYGKSFVEEPDLVKEGKKALRWEVNSKNSELKVRRLPTTNLGGFGAVSFWMNFPKGGSPFQLVFVAPGKGDAISGQRVQNAYFKAMKSHSGWKRIEVPLKEFTPQGQVSWDRIQDFRIQFQGGKRFICNVDYIALVKK